MRRNCAGARSPDALAVQMRQSRHCPWPAFSVFAEELNSKGTKMAEHLPAGPVETGAEMDYAEHDKTYSMFIGLAKYGSAVIAALLIAMALGFFGGFGFFSSLIAFVVISIVAIIALR
jgi:hypothetical protein